MLELAAASGEIDLKYLDESGFCVWTEPGYSYYFRGEQKRLEQTKRRGRRLSIIGFLQPLISFVYGLVIGGVNRKSYIKMMEQEAQEAQQTGRIRVIVQSFRANTSMPGSSTIVEKMGESGFIHIFSTKVLLRNESN